MASKKPPEPELAGQTTASPSEWEVLSSDNPTDQRRVDDIMNNARVRTDTEEFRSFFEAVMRD